MIVYKIRTSFQFAAFTVQENMLKKIARTSLYFLRCKIGRSFSSVVPKYVLGIETSCDETGAAVVDDKGTVLGEGMSSQMKIHLDHGGVIPHIAAHLHELNIENVVLSALTNSKLDFKDISAFASTAMPGLKSSLVVGLEYGKQLARKWNKPFIPVHHMEAHALTVRMVECVEFPFLVLLASGGHCQLAVAKGVNEFLLLGTSCNNTPGEVLDKIARRMKLPNLPQCYGMSGGQAIEFMAKEGNPNSFKVPPSLTHYCDCDFSFSGYFSYAAATIETEEERYDISADGVIPSAKDLCASIQHGFSLHLVHRVQRAFLFCEKQNLIPPENRTLVFSGGVACNQYIRNVLEDHCDIMNWKFACPPHKLCSDNGIMIAWDGMEKLKKNVDVYHDFDHIKAVPDAPLGTSLREEVKKAVIKVKLPKPERNHTRSFNLM